MSRFGGDGGDDLSTKGLLAWIAKFQAHIVMSMAVLVPVPCDRWTLGNSNLGGAGRKLMSLVMAITPPFSLVASHRREGQEWKSVKLK